MTLMNEREQNRLIRGLIRQRDAWKTQETGHKDKASGRAERITAKRLTDRDREVMECAGYSVAVGGDDDKAI
ncbi:hypothetical protein HN161_001519 [Escherichia coli]|nr:hypothetical protein [Escherichia coli]